MSSTDTGASASFEASTLDTLDVHQHLWPEPFLDALRRRTSAPYVSSTADQSLLHLDGEPAYPLPLDDHDARARVAALTAENAAAVIAHSSPLGLEDLPAHEAQPLLTAAHEGLADLGAQHDRLAWWATIDRTTAFGDLSAAEATLAKLISRGAAGLQVPATWLATPPQVRDLAPMLQVLQAADLPLFVHPGAAPTSGSDNTSVGSPAASAANLPPWWAPVVDYPAQMSAAWWAWHAAGREALPNLRVCFAAGAGLAPVHAERFRARGGGRQRMDTNTFVELSGYGHQAFEAMLRVLGIDALISASDHPYAQQLRLPSDPAADHALRHRNPHRLMQGGTP